LIQAYNRPIGLDRPIGPITFVGAACNTIQIESQILFGCDQIQLIDQRPFARIGRAISPQHTDNVIPVMGGKNMLFAGIHLLSSHFSKQLVVQNLESEGAEFAESADTQDPNQSRQTVLLVARIMADDDVWRVQHIAIRQYRTILGHIEPVGKFRQLLPGQAEFGLAISKIHMWVVEADGHTGADPRSGTVGRLQVGGTVAAHDIVGIDIDRKLEADLSFSFERRGFVCINTAGRPREEAAVQVDAVGHPVRKQQRGVVEPHAFTNLLAKSGFIEPFHGIVGDPPVIHILMDQPPGDENGALVIQLTGGSYPVYRWHLLR